MKDEKNELSWSVLWKRCMIFESVRCSMQFEQ